MAEDGGEKSQVGRTQIFVAAIAAVGVIGGASLTNWDKIFKTSKPDIPATVQPPITNNNSANPVFNNTVSPTVVISKDASDKGSLDLKRQCISAAMPALPEDMLDGALNNPESLWNSLVEAAQSGNVACARAMLEGGASPNLPSFSLGNKTTQMTPLIAAIQSNSFTMVKLLLDAGANPNLRALSNSPDDPGFSTLSAAAQSSDDRIGLLLLERGANVNAPDRDNQTGLVRAVLFGRTNLVRALLEKGADKEIREHFSNNTPLEIAKKKGFAAIIKALTEH